MQYHTIELTFSKFHCANAITVGTDLGGGVDK